MNPITAMIACLAKVGRVRLVGIVVGLLAVWLIGGAAHAAPDAQTNTDPLQLEVRVGFDNYVQSGAWVPVSITVSNAGPDLSGTLRVEVSSLTSSKTSYIRAIELPRGSRKHVTLYLNDLGGFGAMALRVDLLSLGRVVTSQRVNVRSVGSSTLLIGVWSDSPGGLADIERVKPSSGETRVATLSDEDLPDLGQGWRALDVLVIANADTGQLSAAQRAAMQEWIAQGGRLVIVGGSTFQRTLAGLSDLTPVLANDTTTISIAPLGAAVGRPFDSQARTTGLIAIGPLADGATIRIESQGTPLLAWRQIGYGYVSFLAPDPGLEPLSSWDGMTELWRMVLSMGEARPGWAYGFNRQWDAAQQAVAAVPGVELPSVLQLCGFLALYVVLVGPVNYIVLTRLKRRELAWLTVPTLVVIFATLAYMTGFRMRGTRAIVHRLAVVQSWPDSDLAMVESLIGIWSPRRARYDIALEPGFLAYPMPTSVSAGLTGASETTVEEGQAVVLRRVLVDVGAVRPFVVEGFTRDVPRIESELTVELTEQGIHVSGRIDNVGDSDLKNVALILAGAGRPLLDLPAGETIRIDETLGGDVSTPAVGNSLDPHPYNPYGSYYPYNYYYGPAMANLVGGSDACDWEGDHRRCDLVSSILSSDGRGSGIYLIGWGDRIPVDMELLNANADVIDTVLYIIRLPVTLSQDLVQRVPPSLMTWRLLDDGGAGYQLSPYDLYLYDSTRWVVFHFEPLPIISAPPTQAFELFLNSYDLFQNPPRVQALNRQTGEWNQLMVNWGSTVVKGPYVDPSGGVDLRIQSGDGISISRFDVTLLASE